MRIGIRVQRKLNRFFDVLSGSGYFRSLPLFCAASPTSVGDIHGAVLLWTISDEEKATRRFDWDRLCGTRKHALHVDMDVWPPALNPVSGLDRSRRRKRRKLGLCLKCGYDLRGLIERRCPECGTSLEKS